MALLSQCQFASRGNRCPGKHHSLPFPFGPTASVFHTTLSDCAVPHTMLSAVPHTMLPAVPHTMLSSVAVPQTMFPFSARVPQTMLSAVPQTMFSFRPAVPHTMFSGLAVPHTTFAQ